MSAVIPGGLWQEKAPPETPLPYQVLVVIGQTFNGRTTSSILRRAAFQIHTYYQAVAGKDPQTEVDALVDATETAFEDQTLTIDDRSSMLVTQNDRRIFEEDAQVYRGLNEFDLRLQKSR